MLFEAKLNRAFDQRQRFNSSPDHKILDLSKLKEVEHDRMNERVENIVEKGENAGNQHFLLFPQCFQNVSL